MKTFTHPDGRMANVWHDQAAGLLMTIYGPGAQVTEKSPSLEEADQYLTYHGFLDDQAEDAARFRFLLAAMIPGSQAALTMERIGREMDTDDVDLGTPAGVDRLRCVLDAARKELT